MIQVLITVKPSERLPQKNLFFCQKTFAWLFQESAYLQEAVKFYTVGFRSELPERLPFGWEHIECNTGSHLEDCRFACDKIASMRGSAINGDVFVQPLLSQPFRRQGLLADAVAATRTHGSAVSVCMAKDMAWREVQVEDGKATLCGIERSEELRPYLDGAIYAWKYDALDSIFDKTASHGFVVNYTGFPCDIDHRTDIPPGFDQSYCEFLFGRK